jgi:hypothetical protein
MQIEAKELRVDESGMVASSNHRRRPYEVVGICLGIALAAGWSILRAGVSVPPSFPDMYQAATIWPERLDENFRAYFTDSPLGTVIFRALPWQTSQSFMWLMIASAVLAIGGLALWMASLAPQYQKSRAARLALLAPLPAVLLTWLGGYDGFTVIAWLVCLAAWAFGRPWVLALAGLLLGFQHFEHAVLGTAALSLTWFAIRGDLSARLNRFSPLWIVPGLLAGKGILIIWLVVNNSSTSGRGSWLSEFLREWTVTAISVGPTLLWACFAGSWAIIVGLVLQNRSRRALVLLAGALAIGFLATFLSGDRPRVLTLVLAPSLALVTLAFLSRERKAENSTRNLALVETIVWLAPPLFLWGKAVIGTNVIDQMIVTWSQVVG